jgi:hypothetical protein
MSAPECKPCFLHKKFMKNCKNCKKYAAWKESQNQAVEEKKVAESKKEERWFNPSMAMDATLRKDIARSPLTKKIELGALNVEATLDFIRQEHPEDMHVACLQWLAGVGSRQMPSLFFCVVFKLMQFQIERLKVFAWLEDLDPYVQAVAMMYLRHQLPNAMLWEKLFPFLLDDTVLNRTFDGKDVVTLGQLAEDLLFDEKYDGFNLPKLPIPLKRDIGPKILLLEDCRRRGAINKKLVMANQFGAEAECLFDFDTWKLGKVESADFHKANRANLKIRFPDVRLSNFRRSSLSKLCLHFKISFCGGSFTKIGRSQVCTDGILRSG